MAETAKLTKMQVRTIRAHPELPVSVFARLYKVAGETVRRARTGETWAWLDAHLDRTSGAPIDETEVLYTDLNKILTKEEKVELDPMVQEILERYSSSEGE